MGRLVAQGAFIEPIPEDTEGEDEEGQEVAAVVSVSAEQACQDLVVIFCVGAFSM